MHPGHCRLGHFLLSLSPSSFSLHSASPWHSLQKEYKTGLGANFMPYSLPHTLFFSLPSKNGFFLLSSFLFMPPSGLMSLLENILCLAPFPPKLKSQNAGY